MGRAASTRRRVLSGGVRLARGWSSQEAATAAGSTAVSSSRAYGAARSRAPHCSSVNSWYSPELLLPTTTRRIELDDRGEQHLQRGNLAALHLVLAQGGEHAAAPRPRAGSRAPWSSHDNAPRRLGGATTTLREPALDGPPGAPRAASGCLAR